MTNIHCGTQGPPGWRIKLLERYERTMGPKRTVCADFGRWVNMGENTIYRGGGRYDRIRLARMLELMEELKGEIGEIEIVAGCGNMCRIRGKGRTELEKRTVLALCLLPPSSVIVLVLLGIPFRPGRSQWVGWFCSDDSGRELEIPFLAGPHHLAGIGLPGQSL